MISGVKKNSEKMEKGALSAKYTDQNFYDTLKLLIFRHDRFMLSTWKDGMLE